MYPVKHKESIILSISPYKHMLWVLIRMAIPMSTDNTFFYVAVVVLVFYGPSTLLRSVWALSFNLSAQFLGKPPRQFRSTLCTFICQ